MVQSKAPTVPAYLKTLSPERRAVIASLRKEIRARLPRGYQETMGLGMICYVIPLRRFADTYNGKPLVCLALAAQKNNYALYTMCAYMDPRITAWLRREFREAGKRLDMGKSCIRFKRREDFPEGLAGELAAKVSVDEYLARYADAQKR